MCYNAGMKTVAAIEMLITDKDQPGVCITASDYFENMPPAHRVALLLAAVQLCGAAIAAISSDNPDDEEEIDAMMRGLSIHPDDQALN
jgi:hypothetical protein